MIQRFANLEEEYRQRLPNSEPLLHLMRQSMKYFRFLHEGAYTPYFKLIDFQFD